MLRDVQSGQLYRAAGLEPIRLLPRERDCPYALSSELPRLQIDELRQLSGKNVEIDLELTLNSV